MTKVANKQIEAWKEEHGGVYALPVEDKTAYLREPKMTDYKRAFTQMQNNGEVAFGEEMLITLWLGGDSEIKKEDAYFLPARKKLINFFNYPDAEINKLPGNKNEVVIDGHKCVLRIITRDDLKMAEAKNPNGKPFVTQEKLFDMVVKDKEEAFADKNNASIRFPLYQAIENLQNQKIALLKKL